jgi:hypothetical protein
MSLELPSGQFLGSRRVLVGFPALDISTPPRALIFRAAKCGCIREMSVGLCADRFGAGFAVFPVENRRDFRMLLSEDLPHPEALAGRFSNS